MGISPRCSAIFYREWPVLFIKRQAGKPVGWGLARRSEERIMENSRYQRQIMHNFHQPLFRFGVS